MPLRDATPADAAAIAALHAANWRYTYRGAISDFWLDHDAGADRARLWQQRFAAPPAGQSIWVAEDQLGLAGFVALYAGAHPEWGGLVDNLHVDRHRQGSGLGRRLLAKAAAACEQHGEGLHLSVVGTNTAAIGFYRRMGGRDIGAEIWDTPDGGRLPCRIIGWDRGAQTSALSQLRGYTTLD